MFIIVEYASNLICFVNMFFLISTFRRQFFFPIWPGSFSQKNLDKALAAASVLEKSKVLSFDMELTLSQTNPGFYVSTAQVFQISPFPQVFSILLKNFLPFFIKFDIDTCKLFQLRKVKNLFFGKGLGMSKVDAGFYT